jgi:hypothetical protein
VNKLSGIALGRMRLADEDGAHQLVVFAAVCRGTGLQRDLRRQLEAGKRMRELDRVKRLFLVGDSTQPYARYEAEPVCVRWPPAGPLLDARR